MGESSSCSDRNSAASHESLQGSGDYYRSLVAQTRVAAFCMRACRARNGASWAPYVVGEWCFLIVSRQAHVFLPGPGSANTVVVGAPKWVVYALRVDFREVK